MSFKEKNTFEWRERKSQEKMEKFPFHVPVIIERDCSASGRELRLLPNSKHLVPKDSTIGSLVYAVRSKIKLPPEKAIFMYIINSNLKQKGSYMMGDSRYYV
jgi:GABA(A) receptor-associated protein